MRAKTTRLWILAAAVALVAPLAALAQAGEGYDPMLQVTHQFAHPDVMIVQDISGSMAWNKYGKGSAVDATGAAPTAAWSTTSATCSGTPPACRTWTYSLTIMQTLPSRMATLKNALGNSMSIYTEWQPPAIWPAVTWTGGTVSGPVVTINKGVTPVTYRYAWTIAYASAKAAPGPPFANGTVFPFYGTGGTLQAPADLIGKNANLVNWGLLTFSGTCGSTTVRVAVSSDDNNQTANVTAIENWMRTNAAGGLGASGSTPTRSGLEAALTSIRATYNADPKKACGRVYATILVTDGLSNQCNPGSGGNWISPCGACPGPSCCDSGSSGSNCPANYLSFAAGVSEANWNATVGSPVTNLRMRTWVIGVSDAVGPCELNFTAYMGRTDASRSDAGMDTAADPYLPTATGDTARYNTAHGNYAYFATTSQALINAFAAIVSAVAAGDYATGTPGASNAGGSTAGTTLFLSSAEFPEWRGHLYAIDYTKDRITNPTGYYMWDAGEALASQAAAGRRIYTWDTAGALIPVTAANLASLQATATAFTPTFSGGLLTANVVDFIRGNDGAGAARPWKLGPIINVQPTVIGQVPSFYQGTVQDHSSFEAAYKNREPVLWAGSNDGMLHAFTTREVTIDTTTYAKGAELFALLPPNLLPAAVDLYTNYDPTKTPMGQPAMPANHIYGVANSPRWGDVWFPSPSPGTYKTVLFLTEGLGGDMLAALDVTDPVGVLKANPADNPVSLLWQKRGATLAGLKNTWSLPAFGFSSTTTFQGVMGSGYDSVSATTTPYAYTFDPANGAFTTAGHTLTAAASSYVRNQAFSDSVIFNRAGETYKDDDIVTQAIQADLHGRLWFMNGPGWAPFVGVDARAKAGQPQPIYYPPSVTGLTRGSLKLDVYVFASGTFYEKDTDLSGPTVGTTGFIPSIYIAVRTAQDGMAVPAASILRIPIKDIKVVVSYDPVTKTYVTRSLGPRTQVLSPQLLVLPASGMDLKNLNGVFTLYDPDAALSCAGESFVLQVQFNVSNTGSIISSLAPPTDPSGTGTGAAGDPTVGTYATSVGSGATSGFVVANNQVWVSKSGIGADEKAYIEGTPITVEPGAKTATPQWWRELQ